MTRIRPTLARPEWMACGGVRRRSRKVSSAPAFADARGRVVDERLPSVPCGGRRPLQASGLRTTAPLIAGGVLVEARGSDRVHDIHAAPVADTALAPGGT